MPSTHIRMGILVGENRSSKLVHRPGEQNGPLLLLPLHGHVDMLDTQSQPSHPLYVLWRVVSWPPTRGMGGEGTESKPVMLPSVLATQKHLRLPNLRSWKDPHAPAVPVAWSHLLLFLPCFLYIALRQLPHYTSSTSHKGLVNFSHPLILPRFGFMSLLHLWCLSPSQPVKHSPAFLGATQTHILCKPFSDHLV